MGNAQEFELDLKKTQKLQKNERGIKMKFLKHELLYLEMLIELNIKTLYLQSLDQHNQPLLDKYQNAEFELNQDLLLKVKRELKKDSKNLSRCFI